MSASEINFEDTSTAFAYKSTQALQLSRLVFSSMENPWVVNVGTKVTEWALKYRLPFAKSLVEHTLFRQFCGGQSITSCEKTIDTLGGQGVATILDYSVEGIKSEEGYDQAKEEALRGVEFASQSAHIPFCIVKLSALGPTDLMTQRQAGKSLSAADKNRLAKCEQRLEEIVAHVSKQGLRLMVDAEESWFQDYIDDLTYRMMVAYNKNSPVVYNTYQLYRHDGVDRLRQAIACAKKEGYHLGAKLVRGAYMEKERARAKEMGYPSPIHETKKAVDEDYDTSLELCMDHISRMGLCIGTHNEASCRYMVRLMEKHGIKKEDPQIFFAQLLGMSDNISFKLASMSYNVAKYVPYGPLEKVLPYLFRRAEENTAIAGQSGRELSLIEKEIKRRKKEKQSECS